jgi:precorrin-2 dehydrogenase/sirohydrochlorin ferrochelatase
MNDAFMVIVATDDPEVNSQIASQAKERGLLVNVVDQPGDCNFTMPSIVKRGDIQIAISTAGKSPALAKKIRKEMEVMFGPEYGSLIALLGLLRIKLLSRGEPPSKNKIIFQKLVDSNLLELIKKGDFNGVRATLRSILGEGFPVEDIIKQVVTVQVATKAETIEN